MGCLPADLNEDNPMDVLVYYWGRTPVAFLQTDKPNEYRPIELVPKIERWFTNAATTADLDGDGQMVHVFWMLKPKSGMKCSIRCRELIMPVELISFWVNQLIKTKI